MTLAAVIYEDEADWEVMNRYEISRREDDQGRVFYRAYRCRGAVSVEYLCEPQETIGGALHYLVKALEDFEDVILEPAEAQWAE